MPEEIQSKLPSSGLLASISDEARNTLAGFGTFLSFQKDEAVIHEDEPQNSLFLVVTGHLHALVGRDGHQVLLGRIAEGEWFGEINIFDPSSASATVISKETSIIWTISREQLEEYLNQFPSEGSIILLSVAQLLCQRVRKMDQRLEAAILL